MRVERGQSRRGDDAPQISPLTKSISHFPIPISIRRSRNLLPLSTNFHHQFRELHCANRPSCFQSHAPKPLPNLSTIRAAREVWACIMVLAEPLQVLNPRSSFFGLAPGVTRVVVPQRCALTVPKASMERGRVSRREVLARVGLALPLLAWATPEKAASASVSRTVRLKDVENPKLQAALRAAVVGDLENAETLFSELLDEDPKSASMWSNRGSVRVSLLKFEQAAEDFSKAIALAPLAPVPFLNRAISYEAMGRFDEAIVDCKTAIVNDPEEYAAWFNLGNVLVRVSDFDSALKAYARASVLAPGIAGYRLKEALVLFQLDRLEETRKLVQGLVRKYPNYAEAHAVLAAVLWKEGNRDLAEGQFSEATSREPRYQDIRWVARELQWPPRIISAMSKFLGIVY